MLPLNVGKPLGLGPQRVSSAAGSNRPGIAGAGKNALSSITQAQKTSHIYQSGDKTGMYNASEHAGQGSSVSINQMLKKSGGGIAGRPGIAGGNKPIMPLIK